MSRTFKTYRRVFDLVMLHMCFFLSLLRIRILPKFANWHEKRKFAKLENLRENTLPDREVFVTIF